LFIDLRTTGTVSKKTKPMDAAIIHVWCTSMVNSSMVRY
jgi:hypothetical protein